MRLASPDVDPEVAIVVCAHQIVERWRWLCYPRPFQDALQQSLDQWSDPLMTAGVKLAIQRVTEAIRSGKGHAFQSRDPLLEIVRRTLARRGELRRVVDMCACARHPLIPRLRGRSTALSLFSCFMSRSIPGPMILPGSCRRPFGATYGSPRSGDPKSSILPNRRHSEHGDQVMPSACQ